MQASRQEQDRCPELPQEEAGQHHRAAGESRSVTWSRRVQGQSIVSINFPDKQEKEQEEILKKGRYLQEQKENIYSERDDLIMKCRRDLREEVKCDHHGVLEKSCWKDKNCNLIFVPEDSNIR